MISSSPVIGCRLSVTTSPVDLVTRTSMLFTKVFPAPPRNAM
jgi:hypothetical protein